MKLGLDSTESFDIHVDDSLEPRQSLKATAHKADGCTLEFSTTCRVDTPVEVDCYRKGGILHTVLPKMAEG